MVTTNSLAGPAPAILRAEHLQRSVGDRAIVDDVSIEVQAGEVLAIVGPSGAGKSSFLRLLNRLDEPTGGTVWLKGQDYRALEPQALRRRLGMVLQTPYLFPGTVGDNIAFGPRQRGEELPRAALEELLAGVGLPGYAERTVDNLSGGEAQRVSVARTLANRPEILLLDEPTSALDPASQAGVEELLLKILSREDLTCLIVTRNMAQAGRLARRAMWMERGRVMAIGPVGEVLHAQSAA